MSKNSRTKRKDKRKKEANARKDANRRLYESYRDSGSNSKRKKNRNLHTGPSLGKVDHPNGPCGNLGCKKCFNLEGKKTAILLTAGPNYLKQVRIHCDNADGSYLVSLNGVSFKAYRSQLR